MHRFEADLAQKGLLVGRKHLANDDFNIAADTLR
jgi:hypothetical protein